MNITSCSNPARLPSLRSWTTTLMYQGIFLKRKRLVIYQTKIWGMVLSWGMSLSGSLIKNLRGFTSLLTDKHSQSAMMMQDLWVFNLNKLISFSNTLSNSFRGNDVVLKVWQLRYYVPTWCISIFCKFILVFFWRVYMYNCWSKAYPLFKTIFLENFVCA